jgi:hypothetical protein
MVIYRVLCIYDLSENHHDPDQVIHDREVLFVCSHIQRADAFESYRVSVVRDTTVSSVDGVSSGDVDGVRSWQLKIEKRVCMRRSSPRLVLEFLSV